MASNTAVGKVTKIEINGTDATEKQYTTVLNRRLYPFPNINYNRVNETIRAMYALTTNTYNDTNLITTISVNEEIYS